MIASPLVIATFCLHLLDINAQENPPILSTPKPAAIPAKKPVPGKEDPKTPPPSRTGVGNQYFIEKLQKLNGDLEQLMGAYNLQIRKMEALEAQVKNLQTAKKSRGWLEIRGLSNQMKRLVAIHFKKIFRTNETNKKFFEKVFEKFSKKTIFFSNNFC